MGTEQQSAHVYAFLPEQWRVPAVKASWLVGAAAAVQFLRPFASVVLSTFVMCFVAQSFISNVLRAFSSIEPWLARLLGRPPPRMVRTSTRRWLVLSFFVAIVAVVTTLVVSTVPRLVADSQYLLAISQSDDPYVFTANTIRNLLGDDATARVEAFLSWRETGVATTGRVSGSWSGERSSRFVALVASQLKEPVQAYLANVVGVTRRIAGAAVGGLLQGVVSLLLSFLIMWDLPNMARGVRSLGQSRRRWVRGLYREVAPQVSSFASIMGRSFEAQALIALVNTALTTVGMLVLGLPGVVFLALFVLLCSFVPVAGFILSTIPMCLVALVEYGLTKMLLVVLMVLLVHLFEAYVANPQIYSSLLELHPILVLSALYVAEHFYGPKGMLLAVPLAEYLVEDVVMGRAGPAVETAAAADVVDEEEDTRM